MNTNDLLQDRGKTHGSWEENASTSQRLKDVMRTSKGWQNCSPEQQEALDLICTKLSRILSGSPNFKDHWDDIAGYATLASKALAVDAKAPAIPVVTKEHFIAAGYDIDLYNGLAVLRNRHGVIAATASPHSIDIRGVLLATLPAGTAYEMVKDSKAFLWVQAGCSIASKKESEIWVLIKPYDGIIATVLWEEASTVVEAWERLTAVALQRGYKL